MIDNPPGYFISVYDVEDLLPEHISFMKSTLHPSSPLFKYMENKLEQIKQRRLNKFKETE